MKETGFRVAVAALGGACGFLAAIPAVDAAERMADTADALRHTARLLAEGGHRLPVEEGVAILGLVYGALEVVSASTYAAQACKTTDGLPRLRHLVRAARLLGDVAAELARLTPSPARVAA